MSNRFVRLVRLHLSRPGSLFMAAAMALSVLGTGVAASVPSEVHAQPLLLEMSASRPDSTVGIIVQKMARSSGVEDKVVALGGKVTRDLSIINAFSAEMPARNVPELARASGVRWISLDAPVVETNKPGPSCSMCVNTSKLRNSYIMATNTDDVWNTAPYRQGTGIGVAIIDSGISEQHDDFEDRRGNSRVVAAAEFSRATDSKNDRYGHGTHVAGIIAGNGNKYNGQYIGMAPKANLINVKVSDNDGKSTAADVVMGMAWVLMNKSRYNIRVVNLSLNSSVYESYHTNPLSAAAEILWFNGIVVVVSAGNSGPAGLNPPANDPFVITVGAADDQGTPELSDDVVAHYSAYGTTGEGFAKPELVAPGSNIVAPMAPNSNLSKQYPLNNVLDTLLLGIIQTTPSYFKMSGTSMSAPVVAGAAVLLLEDEPNLNPDQVKYRLMATANKDTAVWPGYDPAKAGAGYLDVQAAVNGTTTESANMNIQASRLLWSGDEPINWSSVNWNSVNWNSVNWNSVNWNSVNWNSVNWNSTYWGP